MKGKCYFLSLLYTSTNIVQQMIENLCASRVENLTCTEKKVHAFVQVCMCKIEHCRHFDGLLPFLTGMTKMR